jgi:DNA-directed RNA polymerase specialized sigma24 family protein
MIADRQQVEAALGRLSDEHRLMIHLREELGLSYDDMAARVPGA